jgi:hypothetical protein
MSHILQYQGYKREDKGQNVPRVLEEQQSAAKLQTPSLPVDSGWANSHTLLWTQYVVNNQQL